MIVVVDGLRAAALGAYGNTIYPTPALDRFAAESVVFDACFAPAADLAAVYRAMWQSRHPLRASADDDATPSFAQMAATFGYATTLLSDDESVLALPGAASFAQHVSAVSASDEATLMSAPALYHTFGTACEALAAPTSNEPKLIWLHTQGLYGPWQAPLESQMSLLDEGDPPPVEESRPPDIVLPNGDNSETAFRYACAYAAQVMLLDDCWNGLMEAMQAADGEQDWLVMLLGARGFPLGEHDRIGGVDQRLHVEQLHVPWLLRFPDGRGRLSRRSQLVSHFDLTPTLTEFWAEIETKSSSTDSVSSMSSDGRSLGPLFIKANAPWRESLLSTSGNCRSLRTTGWTLGEEFAAKNPSGGAIRQTLYVRPDDRWEANDVAVRCPEVVAELAQIAEDTAVRIRTGATACE